MHRREARGRRLRRNHRYHRIAGYVPLGYGLTCMSVNLDSQGLDAEFGFLAGLVVAVVGLAHLWKAERVGRTRPPGAGEAPAGR